MDWQTLLAVAGGIVLIGNAAALIYKWLRPAYQLTQRVKTLEEHDRKDYETIEALRELSKAQCSALLSIINHMIDGNNKEDMKKTREQIAKILISMK